MHCCTVAKDFNFKISFQKLHMVFQYYTDERRWDPSLCVLEPNQVAVLAFVFQWGWDYCYHTRRSTEIESFWSTDGCGIMEYNSSHTVCVCYHLTNFAVLFDSNGAVTEQVSCIIPCKLYHVSLWRMKYTWKYYKLPHTWELLYL